MKEYKRYYYLINSGQLHGSEACIVSGNIGPEKVKSIFLYLQYKAFEDITYDICLRPIDLSRLLIDFYGFKEERLVMVDEKAHELNLLNIWNESIDKIEFSFEHYNIVNIDAEYRLIDIYNGYSKDFMFINANKILLVSIIKNSNVKKDNYLKDIYEKLTEKGRILFSTGELMYRDTDNYKEFTIDYWPYISSYIKCIEFEVRDRIGETLIKNIPGTKTPLTLGSFNYVFKRYSKKLESILNKKIDIEIIKGFDYLLKLRNPNTHDNIFTYEEYISVRNLLIEEKLLEKIIEIEPLEKIILDEYDNGLSDDYLLNSSRIEGALREVVDYKMINNLKFTDNVLGVNLLNYFSNILLNSPFVIEGAIFLERYIESEIDNDTFGFLTVKEDSSEDGLYGIHYDYVGIQGREDGIDILYSANIWQDNLPLAGVIKVRDNNGQINIYGDDNILKIKRYLYNKLLSDKDDSKFADTFKRFNNKILNMSLESLENKDIEFFKELILKVLGTEDIWLSRDLNSIANSYKLVKGMISSLYNNINTYDLPMKRIIVKACKFCIENIDDINNSQDYHLFPYAIIKVKGEDVVEIKLEKIKNTDNNKTIFEIVLI